AGDRDLPLPDVPALAVAAAQSVAGCRRLRGGERAGADDTRPARGMLRRRARAGGAHTYGARGRVDVRSGGLLAPGDRERLRPHGEFFKIAAVARAPAAARLARAAGKSTVMQPDLEPQHALGRRLRGLSDAAAPPYDWREFQRRCDERARTRHGLAGGRVAAAAAGRSEERRVGDGGGVWGSEGLER